MKNSCFSIFSFSNRSISFLPFYFTLHNINLFYSYAILLIISWTVFHISSFSWFRSILQFSEYSVFLNFVKKEEPVSPAGSSFHLSHIFYFFHIRACWKRLFIFYMLKSVRNFVRMRTKTDRFFIYQYPQTLPSPYP